MEFDDNLPRFICSDALRIRQIIINLIGNAIKFTKQGQILTHVSIYENKNENEHNNMIQIKVKDTGIGIDQTQQSNLFKAFSKLDDQENLNPLGVGLGLMISNELAKKLSEPYFQNTGLQISSQQNQGTEFKFLIMNHSQTFNINESQNRKNTQFQQLDIINEEIIKNTNCQCKKILIVDDTKFNIIALQSYLQMIFNISSEAADSYEQCFEKLQNNFCNLQNCVGFKIIFMDICMPEVDGIEITKRIRKNSKYQNIIIVGCSGYSPESQEYQNCQEAGMNDYLYKPIDKQQLKYLIQKYY
ncbi:hypothetical protein IMG5_194090 [Ichthyophthirius multifiliis]|uniref:Histidine kinase n=1 Tax=Ichthyophthirius multifiliis TaxID=5932 RepID=G0R4P0_ICHMU|nr:hypothetical protein IMG5_194090 [Ichthyophthirius multifiliis]EGR27546.1 hypothetical protein IMG5_194090 [Ichthyophthirius multifiliis]|eukprot:XP_004024998.1 hypothetical protein IMG5_194090 [Ichthyophthirius multifiliis]